MTDDSNETACLDGLLAAARTAQLEPSAALMARIAADAQSELALRARAARPAPARRKGVLAQLREALGGWPAIGGLVAATVAGVWVGVSPPRPVDTLTTALFERQAQLLWIDADTVLALGLGEELM